MVKPLGIQSTSPMQTLMPSITAAPVPATTGIHSTQLVTFKPITVAELADLGGSATRTAANVSDKIIQSTKTIDMDDLGRLMLDTIKTAQGFDPSHQKKGILSFFKNKMKDLQLRFDTVDETIKRNVAEINKRSNLFKTRISDLDQMQKQLQTDKVSIKKVIEDVEARVAWMEANVPDAPDGDLEAAQNRSNWIMAANMGAKRADDLKRLLMLLEQQDATINQMKQNAAALVQKMKDLETTSVPALKMAFTNYILQLEMKKGAEFADAQDKLTNDAINEAARLHGQNTTAIWTSLTRSNIELSTLQNNQQAIITSLNEGERLVSEMRLRLKTEAPQLEQLSADLSAQLRK